MHGVGSNVSSLWLKCDEVVLGVGRAGLWAFVGHVEQGFGEGGFGALDVLSERGLPDQESVGAPGHELLGVAAAVLLADEAEAVVGDEECVLGGVVGFGGRDGLERHLGQVFLVRGQIGMNEGCHFRQIDQGVGADGDALYGGKVVESEAEAAVAAAQFDDVLERGFFEVRQDAEGMIHVPEGRSAAIQEFHALGCEDGFAGGAVLVVQQCEPFDLFKGDVGVLVFDEFEVLVADVFLEVFQDDGVGTVGFEMNVAQGCLTKVDGTQIRQMFLVHVRWYTLVDGICFAVLTHQGTVRPQGTAMLCF